MEISPYGQPVEFWPTIPTPTMIYCLGLVAMEDGAGGDGDEETPIDPDQAFSSPGERIARTRKRNQKTYNVLSIEEDRIINKFARNTFLFKVFLITLVALVAFCLLVIARVRFDDMVNSS